MIKPPVFDSRFKKVFRKHRCKRVLLHNFIYSYNGIFIYKLKWLEKYPHCFPIIKSAVETLEGNICLK